MDDSKIIDLYWQRDERAIAETDSKYGAYCRAVSMNILGVREDAEECVSDTYARAWNAMSPERPGRRERGGYRGETVSYRLGYIIDDRCNNAESVYLYCIRDTGGQLSACYIPVVEQ